MELEWKEYLGNRLIAEHPAGFLVIKQKELPEVDPVFCPLCEAIMSSTYDDEAYHRFKCCDSCASAWAYPDLDRWSTGWRPSREEVMHKCEKRPI